MGEPPRYMEISTVLRDIDFMITALGGKDAPMCILGNNRESNSFLSSATATWLV